MEGRESLVPGQKAHAEKRGIGIVPIIDRARSPLRRPGNCFYEVEGNPKRLKHGCKRWVLGGLVTDLETQQCEQGLDQVRGSVGERLGHHCREIVIEAGPGQAKKASAKLLVRKKA